MRTRKKIGIVLVTLGLLVGVKSFLHSTKKNDIKASSVMITNREQTHGGTGIILMSNKNESVVLTNDHVCKAIKTGGIVTTASAQSYNIMTILESQMSDLCFLTVKSNLGVSTDYSFKEPQLYDKITISGHPALMPNILTYGHVSGRKIIQVITGVRPCTDEEKQNLGFVCAFLGGMPVIKSYESVLVSATIMPGSSGSGVYNERQELIGVVFAGSGDLGYAWTVPYEQLVNFLEFEHQNLPAEKLDQTLNLGGDSEQSKGLEAMHEKCERVNSNTEIKKEDLEKIKEYCSILKKDVLL